ncbi:TetR family transcriptional regulator [Sulfurimonas aquatica]|uniref:TetR family transcriptional regulator n=1 Tax=Sulfurimonas aquatica TaxID=2672570 RepID=A0A975B2C4_9BACT|nr:TetR/AcrR family transcriptional regulator [Sulfurimonas aquatica]QSZ42962.1 TetR family transcriptional regulator [Sulfurimonas aquatica]
MAIIVDKIQKKKDIALSCKELFVENGINNLTIAQVAKTAGVGKGTIYEYFNNKEDIVFEIINILLQEHNVKKHAKLESLSSSKDKIKTFFHTFYEEEGEHLRKLYKEFISISLMNRNQEMVDFQTKCSKTYFQWFETIIQEGIDSKELIPNAIKLSRGLFVLGEGMFILNETTDAIENIEEEFDIFFETLFQIIEVQQ